ncbi:MAG TPA: hypothetical protein VMV26_15895 [Alphaproteobacteria bacterium]|nr:hypothetical protein [Alphaproteobacteria bacterium]
MADESPPTIVKGSDEDDIELARGMIDVHGATAATVARENARSAALAGQMAQARRWLKVVGLIQRRSGPPA